MKKSLLLAALALGAMTANAESYAEYFKVFYDGAEVTTGATIEITEAEVTDLGEYGKITTFEGKPVVTNQGGVAFNVRCSLDIIEPSVDVYESGSYGLAQICAGSCYPSNPDIKGNIGMGYPEIPADGELEFQLHEVFQFIEVPADFNAKFKFTLTYGEGNNGATFQADPDVEEFSCFVVFKQEGSGVNDMASEVNAAPEYFTLQGVRVANPDKGIYIVREGSKVSKRVIR